jgi:RNA polymerase sigma-70 factor, ECF subfamily
MEIGDAAAVALARTGDSDAFRLLVERHGRRVFQLAYRLTGSEADAEDIVQETFLRAYRNLDRFEERALVGSWLYRIATNCALDWIRSRKGEGAVGGPERGEVAEAPAVGAAEPERLVGNAQLQERIGAALDGLTGQERAAFTLRHFEGRSIEEIGEVLHTSASATKQAVFRAVQKLRRALGSEEQVGGSGGGGGRGGHDAGESG